MSVYFVKGKGWRYDFTLNKVRYTDTWFKTKTDAKQAEAAKREEVKNPPEIPEEPTDMAFLDLVNRKLDHVHAYNSKSHYTSYKYMAKRWVKLWGELMVGEITSRMIEIHLKGRKKVSAYTANQDLRYLRATFNYGVKKKLTTANPTKDIEFFPVNRRKKYVPPKNDVLKVIAAGNPEAQQYLWAIVLTAGRVSEVNQMTWNDVDFDRRTVTLWTRKRKGGHREPREVPMIEKLHAILSQRAESRDAEMPWVFWHTYWSRKQGKWMKGPYEDRKKLMATLCKEAKVRYFRFHALRHLTASILDDLGVHIGAIQRILGHQNRRTTEIYLHSVGEAEREAMSKLENARFFSAGPEPNPSAPTNMPVFYWNRKVDRPPLQVLRTEVENLGFAATGRKYGVSDNAVRKWIRSYERRQLGKEPSETNSHTNSHTESAKRKKGQPVNRLTP